MHTEIERKFRVEEPFDTRGYKSYRIVQAYLTSNAYNSVRVRIRDHEAFLTIKGKAKPGEFSRPEWEHAIPLDEAETLLELCEPGRIEKRRFLIPQGIHTWEVDVFEGENAGLVIAEIELSKPTEDFERPTWLGQEVTADKRFYNSYLSRLPFCQWP